MSEQGIRTRRWSNLVSETQFAADLVLTGIRRVSHLPMDGDILGQISYDQTFPLHVGLHTYTSGLERICKLALACHGFLQTGAFVPVREYSHRITELLDALQELDLSASSKATGEYLIRPVDEYEPELNNWLQRYASGAGRYELLDSLSSGAEALPTWETWAEFCSRGEVSDQVRRYIDMHYTTGYVLREVATSHDLESVASGHLEEFDHPFSEQSAAVALAMYRRARWAASILDAVSYYTHPDIPILGEALVELRQSTDNFFAFEIAKLSDPEIVGEELLAHRENFVSPSEDGEFEDWDADGEEPLGAEPGDVTNVPRP
ncbi:hypothetical protein ABC304_13465 [Microbacterium sp. 1P10UB]|uniref:hypothetical protein n=1 Tax=unclassified Microbacterium TaxID=2609290 RepID=UPI0039A22D75